MNDAELAIYGMHDQNEEVRGGMFKDMYLLFLEQ